MVAGAGIRGTGRAGGALSAAAQPAFHLLQAAGRARATALLHLAELPLYGALLWWLAGYAGAPGAALAWVVRVGVSCLLLNVLAWPLWRRPATLARVEE